MVQYLLSLRMNKHLFTFDNDLTPKLNPSMNQIYQIKDKNAKDTQRISIEDHLDVTICAYGMLFTSQYIQKVICRKTFMPKNNFVIENHHQPEDEFHNDLAALIRGVDEVDESEIEKMRRLEFRRLPQTPAILRAFGMEVGESDGYLHRLRTQIYHRRHKNHDVAPVELNCRSLQW